MTTEIKNEFKQLHLTFSTHCSLVTTCTKIRELKLNYILSRRTVHLSKITFVSHVSLSYYDQVSLINVAQIYVKCYLIFQDNGEAVFCYL